MVENHHIENWLSIIKVTEVPRLHIRTPLRGAPVRRGAGRQPRAVRGPPGARAPRPPAALSAAAETTGAVLRRLRFLLRPNEERQLRRGNERQHALGRAVGGLGRGPVAVPARLAPRAARAARRARRARAAHDRFIADRESLADYLRRCSERSAAADEAPAGPRGPPPAYQLAAVDAGAAPDEGSPPGAPQPWWRLDLDPQRLTQWNLNLRLWIRATILEPVVRELAAADEALSRAALLEAGALLEGRAAPGRLRALAALRPAPHPPLAALLLYLEPFADLRYVVRRYRELARGGCLGDYRWNGGGSEWEASQPTDAELVLHAFATYLDGQLAGGAGARPFSAEHVRERGAARAAAGPAVLRLSARPPHYALALGAATLEVARGRNNLLHALLLLLAAAARRDPPALGRTALGRSGLNMLWIIGRDG